MGGQSALKPHDADARSFHPQVAQRLQHRFRPFSTGLPGFRYPGVARSTIGDNNRRATVGRQRQRRTPKLRHVAPVYSISQWNQDTVETGFAGIFSNGAPAPVALGERVTRPDEHRSAGTRRCCPWHTVTPSLAGCSKRSQRRGARTIDERRRTPMVRWSEAIERNETYGSFSAACYVIETIPGVRLISGSPPFSVTSTHPPQLVSKLPSALLTMGLTMKTLPFSISTSRLRAPRFCGVKSGPSSP